MTDIKTVQALVEALDEATHYTSCESWSPSMTRDCEKAVAAGKALIAQMQRDAVQQEWAAQLIDFMRRNEKTDEEIGAVLVAAGYAAPHPEAQALDAVDKSPDMQGRSVDKTTEMQGAHVFNCWQCGAPDPYAASEAQALDSQLQQPDGHSVAGASSEASTTPTMGCACRWVGEEYVERCDFHDAWHTALHEWANRAKTAEAKLRELADAPSHRSAAGAQQQDDHAGSPAPSSDIKNLMMQAHSFCPSSLSHPKRMEWMGRYLISNYAPAQSSKAALSDEEIKAAAKQAGFLFHTIPEYAPIQHTLPEEFSERCFYRFARAILARAGITRKPLTEAAISEGRDGCIETATVYECAAFRKGVRFAERHHGITPQAGKESGDAS